MSYLDASYTSENATCSVCDYSGYKSQWIVLRPSDSTPVILCSPACAAQYFEHRRNHATS